MPIIPDKKKAEEIYSGKLLRVGKAAEIYNIPDSTIRKWIMRGIIVPYRLSPRYIYVYASDIEKMINFLYSPRPNRRIDRQERLGIT